VGSIDFSDSIAHELTGRIIGSRILSHCTSCDEAANERLGVSAIDYFRQAGLLAFGKAKKVMLVGASVA
jgi:hypothetical protein